jgi:hypothetical protein
MTNLKTRRSWTAATSKTLTLIFSMISFPFSSLSKRRGTTLAGVFGLALSCVLLCGAGSVPVENLLPQGAMQGDFNAGGHSLTNAATVSATNVVASGTLTAPASFTLPFSKLTGTPTNAAGYGIANGANLDMLAASNPFTAGTNITFSGTWPAITINASGGGGGGGVTSLGTNFSTLASITTGTLELSAAPNGAGGLLQLNGSGGLPALNGSLLTNLPAGSGTFSTFTGAASGAGYYGIVFGTSAIYSTKHFGDPTGDFLPAGVTTALVNVLVTAGGGLPANADIIYTTDGGNTWTEGS